MKHYSQKLSLRFRLAGVAFLFLAICQHSAEAQTNTFPATGNAGVGTTSPSAALQINSSTPGVAAVKVKGATSQTANLLEFRSSDDTLRSYVNASGALFFNPAMDQVPSALTIAPNFNGAYYAGAEHNAFTINGANMSNYGLYTNPTVRMFLIKDVNGYNAFEVNKIGMTTLRGDMSNRSWVTNIHVDSANAYYAGTADGLLINGTGLASHGLYSGGTVRMLRVVGTGEALAVTRENRTGFGTLTPAARVEIMGLGSTSASVGLSVKNSASSSLLHVRDDGYVGIGTAGPGFKFDVQGGQINSSGGLCIAGDCKTAWSQVGGSGSSQWTNTTTGSNIYFNPGNVGIGTDSPLTKLHVAGGTRVDGASGKVYLGTSAVAGSRGLEFIEENATTFSIRHHDPSVAWRNIVINPHGGSVGIGLISPLYSLDVNGGVNGFRAKAATVSSGDTIAAFENSSGVQAIVRGNGNVGIGTTNPASNLQIGAQTGSSSANPARLSLGGSYSNAAGTNFKLRLYDDGVAGNTYGLGVSAGSMDFGVSPTAGYNWYSGGAHKMTLSADGNLGIGTGATAPTAKLQVQGNINVTGTGPNAGNINISGTINAKYQDVAEWVESSQALGAGTVVVLDHTRSNQVVASSKAYDTRVAGVISVQPGIALGESGAGKVLVATTGRVKIKVDASAGPIQIGDLLVTSDKEGVAKKSEPISLGGVQIHRPGTLIGKALEPLAKGTGEILVLLSLQ